MNLLPTCINDIINDYVKDLELSELEDLIRNEFIVCITSTTDYINIGNCCPEYLSAKKEKFDRISKEINDLPIKRLIKRIIPGKRRLLTSQTEYIRICEN